MALDETLRELRASVLSQLPGAWRVRLRRTRDSLQRGESRLRARLPERWGGRLSANSLKARLLSPADEPKRASLRETAATRAHHAPPEPGRFCMGVFVRDELVGYGYCVGLGDAAAPFRSALYVAGFVHPRWRRRGVARAVHLARLAQLKQLGCEQAFAWVDEINGASRASLERCGFRKITPTPEQLTHRPTPRHELFSAVPRASIP